MEEFDCCAYVKQCTDHPHEKAPKISVRQFLQLKLHLNECKKCSEAVDKTLKENPEKPQDKFSQN